MKPTQDIYPVFEANQVLTNRHLNQVFDYLDEQERLTRANLIGIGIVCGLEISLQGIVIQLTKGCGVTSQGYLIIESVDVNLEAYKPYKLPTDIEYPLFRNLSNANLLWEMFPDGEPNAIALNAAFLKDKAVVLFLELKNEGLRNCSPNNCDDKGSEITATVRRLLLQRTDLDKIIAEANQQNTDLTPADLEAALLARLNLPDLRLPRYDVPNTGITTSNQVLAAFAEIFQKDKLATATNTALTAAYNAFLPLVEDVYPANPFTNFNATFGFLDTAPQTGAQVRFLQYYYDFFDDLLKAYDEFRWKGLDLMCACCPPSELFPRHLMLGLVEPASVNNSSIYRHLFLSSAALSGCEEKTKELVWLFQRLVEMIARFTINPPLSQKAIDPKLDGQIRITPSKLGDVPVSDKAIPYYYTQNGTPPLYRVWNAEKTRRNRANQNLSYRADEYAPAPPSFVLQPLRYDLEPNNFLRIEGHLGKNYQSALQTLLELKKQYRLPIEIIALRTGAFDEKQSVDLTKENCRFEDLEALYDTLREETLSAFARELVFFYELDYLRDEPLQIQSLAAIIKSYQSDYRIKPSTFGAYFERRFYNNWRNQSYLASNLIALENTDSTLDLRLLRYLSYFIAELPKVLPDTLSTFIFSNFETRFKDLQEAAKLTENLREQPQEVNQLTGKALLSWEEIDDRFETIMYSGRLDAFKALNLEYIKRLKEVKQKQFLRYFLQNNPGIQHKAGVPLGGTFILVYHDDPEPIRPPGITNTGFDIILDNRADSIAFSEAFSRIKINPDLTGNPDIKLLLDGLANSVVNTNFFAFPPAGNEETDKIIADTVNELVDGTIIADFFLPYICCSDCSPIQFVLPNPAEDKKTETCDYRWMSSSSFLDNYSRNYRFTIHEYTINGIRVVTGSLPIVINIPKATINSNPFQAIADELNKLNGLKFGKATGTGNNQGRPDLSITRFVADSFILITEEFQNPNIFHKYTENGVQESVNRGETYIELAYGEKSNCAEK